MSSETDQLKEKLDEFVSDKIKDEFEKLKNENNEKSNTEEKHNHAVRSFDKFCTDCGSENPDYKKSEFFCANCESPLGSEDDVLNTKACYNCGSNSAIDKSNDINDEQYV